MKRNGAASLLSKGQGPHDRLCSDGAGEVPADRITDPDRDLDEVEHLLDSIRPFALSNRIEIYRRSSSRVRVTLGGARGRTAIQTGWEEGVAVRLEDRAGGGGTCFGAATGAGVANLRCAVEMALRAGPGRDAARPRWADPTGEVLVDREPNISLPHPDPMRSWLGEALRVDKGAADRRGEVVPGGWVESAVTVETLASDDGLRASRTRTRTWALATIRRAGAESRERIRFLVGRSLESLSTAGWLPTYIHRGRRPASHPPPGRYAIVFAPEPAAILAAALVRVIHGAEAEAGRKVGPGWRVIDDLADPQSLFGVRFDDAGFPTRRCVLAESGRVIGGISGQGHLKRASYRDRPTPMAVGVIVQGETSSTLPPKCLWVDDVRIHSVGAGSWILEIDGTQAGAEPGATFEGVLVRADPGRIAERCVGSVGEARWHPVGVRTAALLVDGLEVVA